MGDSAGEVEGRVASKGLEWTGTERKGKDCNVVEGKGCDWSGTEGYGMDWIGFFQTAKGK